MMFDVCCLGILVADVTAVYISYMPAVGELSIIDNITVGIGGCAANTATDLNVIGCSSAVIGKVGNDLFGTYIVDTLSKSEVDVSAIVKSESTQTSSAIVLVNDNGERSFLHNPGANGDFTMDDIDFSVIEKSSILFVAGSLLLPKLDGKPISSVLQKAQTKGVYTALDTAWDPTGRWMTAIRPCLRYLDLFIPSIEEAKMLSQKSDVEDIANVFLNEGVKLCVIKMGKCGCFVKSKGEEGFFVPSYEKVLARDTNGAGDSFVAGFLTGLIKKWDLYRCAEFANAVGAHCVSKIGTTAGIKSLEETLRFMKEYECGNIII